MIDFVWDVCIKLIIYGLGNCFVFREDEQSSGKAEKVMPSFWKVKAPPLIGLTMHLKQSVILKPRGFVSKAVNEKGDSS